MREKVLIIKERTFMKKTVFIIIMLSAMLSGCMVDDSNIMNDNYYYFKEGKFDLITDGENSGDKCSINVLMKKNDQVVLNKKEKCLDKFKIVYNTKSNGDEIVDFKVNFDKVKFNDNNILIDVSYNIKKLTLKQFKSLDGDTEIEVPTINEKDALLRLAINKEKKASFIIDGFYIEIDMRG